MCCSVEAVGFPRESCTSKTACSARPDMSAGTSTLGTSSAVTGRHRKETRKKNSPKVSSQDHDDPVDEELGVGPQDAVAEAVLPCEVVLRKCYVVVLPTPFSECLPLSPLRKLPKLRTPARGDLSPRQSWPYGRALRPQTVEQGFPLWALRSAKVATTSLLTAFAHAHPKILVMRFNFHSSK